MTRTRSLLMAVVLIIGGVSAFPMATAAQTGSSVASAIDGPTYAQVNENASENATNVTPGERLSGVIGVGQAEFEGEIELRAYGIEYARASANDTRAAVVADRLDRIEQRLAELEQERQRLETARENGEISQGQYNARLAKLAARTETVEEMANASEARAGSLPAELLESKGINVSAIQELKTNAENLTGPEVAAIAKSIAGDDVGRSVSARPPSDIGVPAPDKARDGDRSADDARTTVDRAGSKLDAIESRLEEAEARLGENASENATAALERARGELDDARQALADARSALDRGDDEQASEHAADAIAHVEAAAEHVQMALDELRDAGKTADAGDRDPDEQDDGQTDGR